MIQGYADDGKTLAWNDYTEDPRRHVPLTLGTSTTGPDDKEGYKGAPANAGLAPNDSGLSDEDHLLYKSAIEAVKKIAAKNPAVTVPNDVLVRADSKKLALRDAKKAEVNGTAAGIEVK